MARARSNGSGPRLKIARGALLWSLSQVKVPMFLDAAHQSGDA